MSNKLNKFTDEEKLDILVVLAHSICDDMKTLLKEKGIDVVSIPRKTKRMSFSDLSKSTKHRHKDELKSLLEQFYEDIPVNSIKLGNSAAVAP